MGLNGGMGTIHLEIDVMFVGIICGLFVLCLGELEKMPLRNVIS